MSRSRWWSQNQLKPEQRRQLLAVSLLIGIFVGLAQGTEQGRSFDYWLYRSWSRYWATTDGSTENSGHRRITSESFAQAIDKILYITIDDNSLRDLGLQWPIPRDTYAEVIRRLNVIGAKTIVLDILFDQIGSSPEADLKLKDALSADNVFMASAISQDGTMYYPHPTILSEEDAEARAGFTSHFRKQMSFEDGIHVSADLGIGTYYNLAVLALAHFTDRSPAQVLENLPTEEHEYPTTTGKVLLLKNLRLNYGPSSFVSAETDLAEGEFGLGAYDLAPTLPLADLMIFSDEELKEGFEAKEGGMLVIIGVSAKGGYDQISTPIGVLPGTEILRQVLLNLLLENPMHRAPQWVFITLPVVLGLLLGLIGGRLNFTHSALLLPALMAGAFWYGRQAYLGDDYVSGGVMLPVSGAMATILFVFLGSAFFHYTAEQRHARKVLDMLQEVCPVADIEALSRDGITLGGEKRELTILFSDLRGYTSFAENLDSVEVLNALNEYFGGVGDIFDRHGGLIFDYQGDAQMVVFGLAGPSKENHAAAACRAALDMHNALKAQQADWEAQGRTLPDTGIGICTGDVSFGFMGTRHRKQQVAIGDPTNTAARLQGKSAELNAPVLMSERSAEMVEGILNIERLDDIFVKGKKKALRVYALDLKNPEMQSD